MDIGSNDNGEVFVLKQRYSGPSQRYVRGVHFTKQSLSCSTKVRLTKKVCGRSMSHLALLVIRNLKKAGAVADEWIDDGGGLPSGKTWDDLYDHVISNTYEISTEKIPIRDRWHLKY